MSAFDVRIHAIPRRPGRDRPFEVRWHAGGRARSPSFITRGLADSYRAELVRAARKGLDFSPGTGEPASWAAPEASTANWLEHPAAYAAMKWPPGGSPHPGRDRRRAGRHHPSSSHARAGQTASSDTAYRPLRARVQPGPDRH